MQIIKLFPKDCLFSTNVAITYNLLNMGAPSGSLPSDEEIREGADNWVFEINGMKWSNNDDTAGDNFGSFIAGVKWLMERISNDH